jgi:SulP family sulfate permease
MSFADTVRAELEPSRLIANLTAGLVVSIVVVIVAVSLGTLIFGGKLTPYLSIGLGIMMFSGVLITAATSLFSSYPGMVAYPQERVAPIFAVIATSLVAQLSDELTPDQVFYTVVAAIALTSMINGVFLAALGFFKLGALIRFIPYPVIGGFLAGTGYLLIKGSLGVMTGVHVDAEHLHELIEGQHTYQWIAGVIFGIVVVWATHHYKKSWVLPSLLLGGILVVYVVMFGLGVSPEEARAAGWLLGPFPEGEAWSPIAFKAIGEADIQSILGQGGNVATILLISVISVLLNSGALELIVKEDIDLNRELKVAGGANVLIGLGGGSVGFHSLAMSRLAFQMDSRSRVVGLIAAVTCFVMLLVGSDILTFLPRLILGGLLFFLGMHFLIEWVYESWFRLTRSDYAVIILILAVVAGFGYLQGVVVGTLACVILFLVNYSKVKVVKHAMTGTHQQSNVDRPGRHSHFLQEHGDRLNILKLQSFIFFGTANGLLEQVRARVAQAELEPLDFMVLDFKAVTGIDSSSVLSFVKMTQLAEKNKFTLIFTEPSADIVRLLKMEGFDDLDPVVFRRFDDLDHGLEWCENQLLGEQGMSNANFEQMSLREQLKDTYPHPIDLDRLLSYFERLEVKKEQVLIREGDQPDDLFLIESGQVTAKLELAGSADHRLRTMCAGAVIGELGMILNEPRTATVVADRDSVIYRLSTDALHQMEEKDADVAVWFHQFMTHLLADRLSNTSRAIRLLLG